MAKSKLDRMSEIQTAMEEADLSDVQSRLEEFASAAQNAVEAMEAVAQAAATAAEAHEEREWESRNDSLSEIPDQLEVLTEALDGLEELDSGFLSDMSATVSQVRAAVVTASAHADHLVEV